MQSIENHLPNRGCPPACWGQPALRILWARYRWGRPAVQSIGTCLPNRGCPPAGWGQPALRILWTRHRWGRPAVGDCPSLHNKKSPNLSVETFLCWRYLSSRPVTQQVLSAKVCLTSVFGMGTGGPTPQSTPTASKRTLYLSPRSKAQGSITPSFLLSKSKQALILSRVRFVVP